MTRHKFHKRSFRNRVYKSYRKSTKPSLSVTDVLIAGALYGAVRPVVSSMLPSFFSFGPVDSDNVILGGAGYFASKQPNKLIKAVGLIAMGTEAGIVAANLVSGNTAAPNNSNIPDY